MIVLPERLYYSFPRSKCLIEGSFARGKKAEKTLKAVGQLDELCFALDEGADADDSAITLLQHWGKSEARVSDSKSCLAMRFVFAGVC